jgi:hypothetical protein
MTQSIGVTWDNEQKTVIRYDFPARWTWDEFFQVKVIADTMIDATRHREPIGALFVFPQKLHIPPDVINAVRNAMHQKHPRAFLLVVVADNALIHALLITLAKISLLARQTLVQAKSIEAGREIIRQQRAEIDALNSKAAS